MDVTFAGTGIVIYIKTKKFNELFKTTAFRGIFAYPLRSWVFTRDKAQVIKETFGLSTIPTFLSDFELEQKIELGPEFELDPNVASTSHVQLFTTEDMNIEVSEISKSTRIYRKRLLGLYPGKMVPLTASEEKYFGGRKVIDEIYRIAENDMNSDRNIGEDFTVEDYMFSSFGKSIVFGWDKNDNIHIFEVSTKLIKRGKRWYTKGRYLNPPYGQPVDQFLHYYPRKKKWVMRRGHHEVVMKALQGQYVDKLAGGYIKDGTLFDYPIDTAFQGQKMILSELLHHLMADHHDTSGIVLFTDSTITNPVAYNIEHKFSDDVIKNSDSVHLRLYLEILDVLTSDTDYEFTIRLIPELFAIQSAPRNKDKISKPLENKIKFYDINLIYDRISGKILYPEQTYIENDIIPDIANYINISEWYIPHASYITNIWNRGKRIETPPLYTLFDDYSGHNQIDMVNEIKSTLLKRSNGVRL
jgi:hypothetical protein